jgi:hypothetical protein
MSQATRVRLADSSRLDTVYVTRSRIVGFGWSWIGGIDVFRFCLRFVACCLSHITL